MSDAWRYHNHPIAPTVTTSTTNTPPATRWFPCHDVWADETACYICGHPGIDVRSDGRLATARSWRNPATWTPDLEESA